MKFARCAYPRVPEEVAFSPRKVAAVGRRLERERSAVALLPDLVCQVATVNEDLANTKIGNVESHRYWRKKWADAWRDGRRRLDALPERTRRAVRAYWSMWCDRGHPASPGYFCCVVAKAERGECYWRVMRKLRQLALVGAGRLPRDLLFQAGFKMEPHYRRRDWRDRDIKYHLQRRARKMGLVTLEQQRVLPLR